MQGRRTALSVASCSPGFLVSLLVLSIAREQGDREPAQAPNRTVGGTVFGVREDSFRFMVRWRVRPIG